MIILSWQKPGVKKNRKGKLELKWTHHESKGWTKLVGVRIKCLTLPRCWLWVSWTKVLRNVWGTRVLEDHDRYACEASSDRTTHAENTEALRLLCIWTGKNVEQPLIFWPKTLNSFHPFRFRQSNSFSVFEQQPFSSFRYLGVMRAKIVSGSLKIVKILLTQKSR